MKNLWGWALRPFFGDPDEAARRARANEARLAAQQLGDSASIQATLRQLAAPDATTIGTLADGRPVRLSPQEIGRHGLVWGSSGSGKSYYVSLCLDAFTAGGGSRRVQIIDGKNETVELIGLIAAQRYLALPADEREVFASRYHVLAIRNDRVTPANLFALPPHMSPALLASLRAAAVVQIADHSFSDLMGHALFLIFATAIALQCGITPAFARRFFLDDTFRERILLPKIVDGHLREMIAGMESLPIQSRVAVVRQFEILLSSRAARVSFGLSPSMVASLTTPGAPEIVLGAFGPTLSLPPAAAKAQMVNRVIDVLTDAAVRAEITPELVVIEEFGVIAKNPTAAAYVLDGSRTLRWKQLALVAAVQDVTNAIPREVLTALALNSRWMTAFECGRDDAQLLLSYLPPPPKGQSEAERRAALLAEAATLPPQHCLYLRKGSIPLRLRTRDVPDPVRASGRSRDELLSVFYDEIASRSMVRIADAEALIAEWERDFLQGAIAPQSLQDAPGRTATAARTVDELFAHIARKRGDQEPT